MLFGSAGVLSLLGYIFGYANTAGLSVGSILVGLAIMMQILYWCYINSKKRR